MTDYKKYEIHTLVDLLADETSRYTKMIAANILSGEEFERCKRSIEALQKAIRWKKKTERIRRNISGEGDWVFAF